MIIAKTQKPNHYLLFGMCDIYQIKVNLNLKFLKYRVSNERPKFVVTMTKVKKWNLLLLWSAYVMYDVHCLNEFKEICDSYTEVLRPFELFYMLLVKGYIFQKAYVEAFDPLLFLRYTHVSKHIFNRSSEFQRHSSRDIMENKLLVCKFVIILPTCLLTRSTRNHGHCMVPDDLIA